MTLAASVHDTDHPGFNNAFLVNTKNKMAVRYNDVSVLENHHIALAFDIMLHSMNMRVFDTLPSEDFIKVRKMMVNMVINTDMALHFNQMTAMKVRFSSQDFDPIEKDKGDCMNLLVHIADISNPTKPWDLCFKWTELLFVEFFAQGDKEKEFGLPISFLMDRDTTNIAKSQ